MTSQQLSFFVRGFLLWGWLPIVFFPFGYSPSPEPSMVHGLLNMEMNVLLESQSKLDLAQIPSGLAHKESIRSEILSHQAGGRSVCGYWFDIPGGDHPFSFFIYQMTISAFDLSQRQKLIFRRQFKKRDYGRIP
jgi:hypothetical protein